MNKYNKLKEDKINMLLKRKSSNNSMKLFQVEPPLTLPKPNIDPLSKALADEDEISINRFDEIMMNNCDYERVVNQNMI